MATEDITSGQPAVPGELYQTLESLEELVDFGGQTFGHAHSIPLDEFHALMDRLRADLPRVIAQADEIAARVDSVLDQGRHKADTVLTDARAETERILEAAHKQVAARVQESAEVRFANAQSRDITEQAQQAAMNIRQDVDAYARETLDRLEDYVKKVQNQVRSGLVALDRKADVRN
jgi:vacuolar-type H+-ATPase subunit E/Vma4